MGKEKVIYTERERKREKERGRGKGKGRERMIRKKGSWIFINR